MGGGRVALEFDRRRFLAAAAAGVGLVAAPTLATGCAPKPSLADARGALAGLWDAAVPGTYRGVVEDWLAPGVPAPGAEQARVQDWIELVAGTMPAPLDGLTGWFFRAWAADLDLWADTFHPPFDQAPGFADLPLGPSFAERGRQYKVMLMMGLFDGPLDLKYFLAMAIGKIGFYCDGYHHATGEGEPVGSRYIGFPGPTGTAPTQRFSYQRSFGVHDARLTTVGDGLVAVP
jgi:hypothetical protein